MRHPRPIFNEHGQIVGIEWPCGHTTDDPGDNECMECARQRAEPKIKKRLWMRAAAI